MNCEFIGFDGLLPFNFICFQNFCFILEVRELESCLETQSGHIGRILFLTQILIAVSLFYVALCLLVRYKMAF